MVILLVHDQPEMLAALAEGLSGQWGGTAHVALGDEAARILSGSVGPEVRVIVTVPEFAPLVADWRAGIGPVRGVFLVPGEPAAWSDRLPGELLLPAEPLPIGTLADWLRAVETPPETRPVLGDYELLEIVRENDESVTYRALQQSVQRIVALERLKSARVADPGCSEAFRAMVRAKALVAHPHIVSVYETQERDGMLFYTREWVEGDSLAALRQMGRVLAPGQVIDLLSTAAEAVAYLDAHRIPRTPLAPADVLLGRDGLSRIANIASHEQQPWTDPHEEMSAVAQAAQAVTDPASPSRELAQLWARLREAPPRGIRTWGEFRQALELARKQAEGNQPPRTSRLSAGTQAIVLQRRRRRRLLLAGILAGGAAVIFALYQYSAYWNAPEARPLDEMVEIPGGLYPYQNGEMVHVPAFWISKYEVTIAQYAAFLEVVAKTPSLIQPHPRQPKAKTSHIPPDWDKQYGAARRGGLYRGQPVDLNCPVTGVDYWDARAYAQWKGRRLPTEEEWEKAGRDGDSRRFPWGDHADARKANTGADYAAGHNQGKVDGFAGVAPVDAFAASDISHEGVVGLAGNVSEWTDSTMLHPEVLDQQVPVLRGGSYASRPMDLLQRRPAPSPEAIDPALGFRTVSDHAP